MLFILVYRIVGERGLHVMPLLELFFPKSTVIHPVLTLAIRSASLVAVLRVKQLM